VKEKRKEKETTGHIFSEQKMCYNSFPIECNLIWLLN